MAKLSSQPIIKRLINKFGKRFILKKESQNKFVFDGAYYQPDLAIYNSTSKKLLALMEVEQGTRKHVIGGIITADYCMGLIKQKPMFCVLALTKQDLQDYKKRLKLVKSYIKNLKKVIIGDTGEIENAI